MSKNRLGVPLLTHPQVFAPKTAAPRGYNGCSRLQSATSVHTYRKGLVGSEHPSGLITHSLQLALEL